MDTPDANAWLDEVDLDPKRSWLAMSTRGLGDEAWLLADDHRDDELGLRGRLLAEHRDEVLVTPASADDAAAELAGMVVEAVQAVPVSRQQPSYGSGASPLAEHLSSTRVLDGFSTGRLHPLEWLGRSIQEDLCLLRRGVTEWELEAGVVCFPSRWSLPDRVGMPMSQVHGPTPGFDPVLIDRVTSLLDRLGERVVRRRNWFIHPDPALFQPRRPEADPVIPAERVASSLWVRSERQTLRSLPQSGRVVFTIRTQQCSLGQFMVDRVRRERLADYLERAPADQLEHRGLSPAQLVELRRADVQGTAR